MIFHDDRDRELFVATLAEACGKADWQVHAFCLMGNYFHLVVDAASPGYLRTAALATAAIGSAPLPDRSSMAARPPTVPDSRAVLAR